MSVYLNNEHLCMDDNINFLVDSEKNLWSITLIIENPDPALFDQSEMVFVASSEFGNDTARIKIEFIADIDKNVEKNAPVFLETMPEEIEIDPDAQQTELYFKIKADSKKSPPIIELEIEGKDSKVLQVHVFTWGKIM